MKKYVLASEVAEKFALAFCLSSDKVAKVIDTLKTFDCVEPEKELKQNKN